MSLLDASQQLLPLEWRTRLLCVVQFISTNVSYGDKNFRPVYCGIQAVELALGGQYIKRRCPSARVSFLVNGSSRFASSICIFIRVNWISFLCIWICICSMLI